MRRMTKVLALAACAGLLVIGTAIGTMAYLTKHDKAELTFTVGDIRMALNTSDEGQIAPVALQAGEPSIEIRAGEEYDKKASVVIDTGSENCFVFVQIQNDIAHLETDRASSADLRSSIAEQMADNGWVKLEGKTGVYYYSGHAAGDKIDIVSGGELPIYDGFKIDGDKATTEQLDALREAGAKLKVTAYAVQSFGFENNEPIDIWAVGDWDWSLES